MADDTHAFKWSGIDTSGKRKKGVIRAAGIKEAQNDLKKMGIEVIHLDTQKSTQLSMQRAKKIKPKDIQLFTRYLSTMLAAGLPIIQALDIVGTDQDNPTLKALIFSIKSNIASGQSMSETFAQHPQYFSPLYSSLIKAGESSGTLDKILNRLALYLEKSEMIKRKIKKALTYPIAILSVAFIVSGILLIFVVPQFQKMFASFGAQLPAFTMMVVHLSNFLRSYWWLMLLSLVILIFWFRHQLRTSEQFRYRIDRFILRFIIIGNVLKKGIIARFTRTLATTLEAGIPIVDAMKSMAPIMGNSLYSKGISNIADDLISGNSLSTAMRNTELFPNMVIQMISVGEASGKLPDMLSKIADYYEEEVNSVVDNLSSLLEPLIMVILGVVIGTFVIAMYLPIFKIGSLAG
ncbi:MAG: type II secretion system F family protein [Gammaproteobacteria bacterium]